MQKIATQIFVYASVTFGLVGILVILTSPNEGENSTDINMVLTKLLMVAVFIILPSFALSVAGKYLNGKF